MLSTPNVYNRALAVANEIILCLQEKKIPECVSISNQDDAIFFKDKLEFKQTSGSSYKVDLTNQEYIELLKKENDLSIKISKIDNFVQFKKYQKGISLSWYSPVQPDSTVSDIQTNYIPQYPVAYIDHHRLGVYEDVFAQEYLDLDVLTVQRRNVQEQLRDKTKPWWSFEKPQNTGENPCFWCFQIEKTHRGQRYYRYNGTNLEVLSKNHRQLANRILVCGLKLLLNLNPEKYKNLKEIYEFYDVNSTLSGHNKKTITYRKI